MYRRYDILSPAIPKPNENDNKLDCFFNTADSSGPKWN